MKISELNAEYWDSRWQQSETGWDIGYPAPAIVKFVDAFRNKAAKILIPGCGNAYEAEYLHRSGFTNVFIADFSKTALESFSKRVPEFPAHNLLCSDFFDLREGGYDLILEQTFFCALNPELRSRYAEKMYELLNENGVLAGLLFNDPMNADHPPFGGSKSEYEQLFASLFRIEKMEMCSDSIQPRAGKELWFELRKR